MINIVIQSTYYQLLIFFRIKQAVFFSIIFPVFLFVIFGSIWGDLDPNYIELILSGLIGITIASDGLFAIGPVVKDYYANGLIKYLRKLPFNILWHFIGLILSRIISLVLVMLVLCLAARLVFNYHVTLPQLGHFVLGIFVGLFLFSFIGLVVTFSGIKYNSDKGAINLVYFVMLFTSNALYRIGDYNDKINFAGNLLPLNAVLNILRGGSPQLIILIWLVATVLLFYYLFNKVRFAR